jgi:putative DNA primase/helicase
VPNNERDEIERRGQRYLLGIGFVQGSAKTAKTAVAIGASRHSKGYSGSNCGAKKYWNRNCWPTTAKTLTQSGGNRWHRNFLTFCEVCNLVSQFTDAERQKLVELLTQPQPLPKKVTPEDAQKMRDIALVWWPEYYPEQMQALLTQMYGWQAPGTKYDVATLAEWLEGEDDLIRDRITELIHRRRG